MSKGDRFDRSPDGKKQDVQGAMGRLEEAVKELGDAAKGNFAERAAEVLEQTAAKLKREQRADGAAFEGSSGAAGDDLDAMGRLGHWQRTRTTKPFRDLDNARLWGICAGTAPYLGLEIWVVRCMAITCFIFMPQVIVPAYVIAYFVLDPYSALDAQFGATSSRRSRRLRKRQLRQEKARASADAKYGEQSAYAANREAEAPAKPESRFKTQRQRRGAAAATPPPPPTRTVLRNVKGTLNEAELRLRRMEGHITSGRYELQKELRKIDA